MGQECVRCGSTEYLEAIRLASVVEKDGKKLFTYDLKCNKCGRVDPYTTEDSGLIDPRTLFRLDLEMEGMQKQAVAGRIDASSDQFGAPSGE